jgi:hypothetical protein
MRGAMPLMFLFLSLSDNNSQMQAIQPLWIVFLVIGVLFFMVGMHGIDNGWNLAYVQNAVGGEWFDSSYLITMTPLEVYNRSVMVTFAGFLVSVLSGLMIFYGGENVRVRR